MGKDTFVNRQMMPPVLEYRRPDPAPPRNPPVAWRGGLARGIVKIGLAVALVAWLVPAEVGENIIQPNPLRILATWLLLSLAAWYVLDRLISTPERCAGRVAVAWSAAALSLLSVYVQIWFLKDEWLPQNGGPWRPAVLWPSACAFAGIAAFTLFRDVRRPVAG